jgi:hypothetical protein
MMKKKELTGHAIDAMTEAERAKLIADIEARTPEQHLAESKALTKSQRVRFKRFQKRANAGGRPVVGKGAKPIAVTIEKGLLKEADAYAKAHGLKRAELIAQGLRRVIGRGKPRAA